MTCSVARDWAGIVTVRPLVGAAPPFPLSPDTGEFPTFLRDGRLAFMRDEQLITQTWREHDGRFETGPEKVLTKMWHGSGWLYGAPIDQMADGRLLAIVRTTPEEPPRIRVVLGWEHER